MRRWQRLAWEVLAVVLLVPQLFVLLYHYRLLFAGGSALGLLKALCLYGLTISWVSAPFLALLFESYRRQRKQHPGSKRICLD